jgi:Heavy metal binding domain
VPWTGTLRTHSFVPRIFCARDWSQIVPLRTNGGDGNQVKEKIYENKTDFNRRPGRHTGWSRWLAPHHSVATVSTSLDRKILYYACPMHPAIKYDHPGNCPICGMKLQPVYADELKTNAPAATPAGCCSASTTQ